MHPPDGILETVIYARDIAAAKAFYTHVFGLKVVAHAPDRFVFLACAQQMLLVFDPDQSRHNDPAIGIPSHGAEGQGHLCFRARDRSDLDAWRDQFNALGVEIEHEHVWENGGRSLYLRDPAGNSVEIAEAAIWGLG